ncbi:hypothetical protein IRJ41_014817 [Triplophysa rosa]|uniref:Uncharacterized protein n=1 Tax=Triplophysa rosa TaxID=992332 RepID=A0A9W7WLR2_TRIRA|nr:hypothetical protein IRJ41_014817 [Triplophysa rosa]
MVGFLRAIDLDPLTSSRSIKTALELNTAQLTPPNRIKYSSEHDNLTNPQQTACFTPRLRSSVRNRAFVLMRDDSGHLDTPACAGVQCDITSSQAPSDELLPWQQSASFM